MGVALENARLFEEIQRRTRESAALAQVGRDISSTLDLPTVMDRIARHAKDLLAADHSAIFLPRTRIRGRRRGLPRHRRGGRGRSAGERTRRSFPAWASSAASSPAAVPSLSTTRSMTRAQSRSPAPAEDSGERLMVAPLRAGKTVSGAMAVWRTGGKPFQD
jgi:GAF domain-containing protein